MQLKSGSGNKGLDWVFILGAIAAYPKTADLLSLFSPQILNDIFGMDMGLPYGLFCAALVEGVILFLHFDRRAYFVTSAQTVKWLMFGVSFLCQVFDGYVTTDQVAQMSDTLKLVLTYGIPTLPLIIAAMVAMIGPLPDAPQEQGTKVINPPRIGLKTRLHMLWHGDSDVVYPRFEQTIDAKTGETTEISYDDEPVYVREPEKRNGNPTKRQR